MVSPREPQLSSRPLAGIARVLVVFPIERICVSMFILLPLLRLSTSHGIMEASANLSLPDLHICSSILTYATVDRCNGAACDVLTICFGSACKGSRSKQNGGWLISVRPYQKHILNHSNVLIHMLLMLSTWGPFFCRGLDTQSRQALSSR